MWSPTLPEWDLTHEDGLSCEVFFLLSLLRGEEFCVALLKLFPHFWTDPQASTFTVSSHFFGIWQKQSSTPLGQFVWLPKNKENKALSHGGKPYSQLAI